MSQRNNRRFHGAVLAALTTVLLLWLGGAVLRSQVSAATPLGEPQAARVGPDVTVFRLDGISNYGSSGGIRGYSVGTDSCNIGDQPLNWCNVHPGGCGAGKVASSEHPVIAQNLYRLSEGRFEQIGMSWLKHGFLSLNTTSAGCAGAQGQPCTQPPLGGRQLGVGCTDLYSSTLNGSRPLGPRSEVNAASGEFPYPHGGGTASGPYEQRLKVLESDLDATINPGALFWVEGQYVTPDDAQAGNGLNNASYRPVSVGAAPSYNLTFNLGGTVREKPAIFAWQVADPGVELLAVDVPGSSPTERFHVARRVTDLGGSWRYVYAVHNLNSDRSARSFAVEFHAGTQIRGVGFHGLAHHPEDADITEAGFHGIEHHSGEPYATTPWDTDTTSPNAVTWSTVDFATDNLANALRWGTMFTFWFEATSPPTTPMQHTLGLFKPGTPESILVPLVGSLLFADGFESGGTGAWSETEP
jgi:hypothetical protein